MTAGLPTRPAVAVHAEAGRFAYDTMTLVGPGTWEAARAAVDCALTAADLVLGGRARGVRAVPAARPPRDPGRLRRLVLPQQRRGRGRGAASRRARAGGGHRHRRAPGQRHGRDLLRPRRTCSTARSTSTPLPGGSRTSWATPTRPAPATARVHPQPAAARGDRRRPLAGGDRRPGRLGGRRGLLGAWSSPSASTPRPTTPRARSSSPADGYRAAGVGPRREPACPPSSSRRAATTCRPSAAWSRRTWTDTQGQPPASPAATPRP